VAAFFLTRLMSSLLFGVDARDITTYSVVALFLAVVSLLASYLPEQRAASVQPLDALRWECRSLPGAAIPVSLRRCEPGFRGHHHSDILAQPGHTGLVSTQADDIGGTPFTMRDGISYP
jgi:hypothetical protein